MFILANNTFTMHIVALKYQWCSHMGHTGARALATRGCPPPVQVLLKIIGALSIANRVLKVHKDVEIELLSIAICIFRIMRSRMLL